MFGKLAFNNKTVSPIAAPISTMDIAEPFSKYVRYDNSTNGKL
jgi:hypothetical protein